MGIDTAFIPGGIHGAAMGIAMGGLPMAASYRAVAAASAARPTWMIPALIW
jgi:hypothetical protein